MYSLGKAKHKQEITCIYILLLFPRSIGDNYLLFGVNNGTTTVCRKISDVEYRGIKRREKQGKEDSVRNLNVNC